MNAYEEDDMQIQFNRIVTESADVYKDYILNVKRLDFIDDHDIPWMEISGALATDGGLNLTLTAEGVAEESNPKWFSSSITNLQIMNNFEFEGDPRVATPDPEARRIFIAELVRIRNLLSEGIERLTSNIEEPQLSSTSSAP